MQIFSSIEAASHAPLIGAAICLGNFDGVHLGHRALFQAAARHGPVVALTFLPHPGRVLQPSLAPRLITPHERKLELLESLKVHAAVVQPFSPEYARTSREQFEHSLFRELGVRAVVVGQDFSYGARRAGTLSSLGAAATSAGAVLEVVPAVTVEGVVVSSSRIREYVLEGRVEAAARLLGRAFELTGSVVRGAGRGRTIGFPTANLETGNELLPATGVYAARVFDGARWHGAAANIGAKPTFSDDEFTIEAHLLDYSGDLYGKALRVEFLERLRSVRSFRSPSDLVAQIEIDVIAVRAAVARAPAA
jgi:riboflavin kinase/FMN adenylyltransferase